MLHRGHRLTFATNFVTALVSAAVAARIMDGSFWETALACFLTGFAVMSILSRVNP